MADGNPEDRIVEVLGIPDDVDDEFLSLYFENKRSGGGTVISLDRNGDRALLEFDKAEVAARVLSKDSHSISNCQLTVRKKPSKDHGKFVLRGLSPNTVIDMVELFVENLTGTDEFSLYPSPGQDLVLIHLRNPLTEGFQKISEKVSKKTFDGAKISLEQVECTDSVLVENLPPSVTEDILTMYFESSRSGGGPVMGISKTAGGETKITFKDVESVDRVLQNSHRLEETDLKVKPYFSFLEAAGNNTSVSLMNGTNQPSVDQNQTVNEPLSSTSSQPSTASHNQPAFTPKPQPRPRLPSSPVSPKTSLPAASSPVAAAAQVDYEKDAMEVVPSEPEPLVCSLSVPDPTKLQLIGLSGLLDDLKKAHPNFDITLKQDGVHIKGAGHLQAEKLKNKILEFLSGFTQVHVPLSALKAELLEKEGVKDKVLALLRQQGLPSVYMLSDCVLIVTSPTMTMVNQACEKIKSLVVEAAVPLKTEYESMLYCQEFQDFKKSLDMCCAEITDSAVAIVTLKGLEEDVKGRIIQFLSTPLQKERVLSMEPAMLTYIQLHHQQLLFDMNQLTTILPLESGDGLMIRGNASECQMVAEVLGSVVDSTLTKTITVTQPGIARFLVQEEGTSILGEMTAKFQVYICLEKVHWESLEDQDIFELAWKMTSCQNFSRDSSGQPDQPLMATMLNASGIASADKGATACIEEAKRILSVFDHSSEPSSLRVTDMEEEEDLYSDPSADQHGDGSQMQAEDSSGAADLGKISSLNPCSLEEDAELSLAIQLSMETNQRPNELTEDELQKVLELSRSESMVVDESQMLEKAVDVSLQEAAKSANVAEIKVFASYPHDLIRVDIALSKKVGLRHCEEKVEHRSLRKLSAYHKRCIELVKKKHAVEIQIQGTTATVTGFKDYVSEALPDLREVLKRAANTTSDTEILKTIQWVRTEQGSSGPVPYPPEAIVFIENAWRLKRKKIDIVFNSQPYTIDLEKMQEYSVSSGKSVPIARKISSEDLYTDLPDDDYSLLSDVPDTSKVDEGSEEFQDVVSQFYDSIHEYHNRIKIIKVEKLMNKLLYNQYRLKKASVVQSSTQPQVERTLFHGTSETSVKEICVHGFNRSFCGKNATVYGQGVYFAVESALSVSDTYSPQNADGHKFIFVAKVLTGDYTVGRHDMKAAPPKEGSGIAARYHSVTDKIDSPTLFVIFNDTQAFPQYLITCKKVN